VLDAGRVKQYGWLLVVFEITWLVILVVLPSLRRIGAAKPEVSVAAAA
jgi:hypothetical protein